MKRRNKIIKFFIRVFRLWRKSQELKNNYSPTLRIASIAQDNSGNYVIDIQIIGSSNTFQSAPEKLLEDDDMVNSFSPTDVRTMTYLGYLDINSPKYKILAKKLSQKHDQMLFAIYQKNTQDYKVVTANEISKNQDIIRGLSQEEAHMVGLTTATEQTLTEDKQKILARSKLKIPNQTEEPKEH